MKCQALLFAAAIAMFGTFASASLCSDSCGTACMLDNTVCTATVVLGPLCATNMEICNQECSTVCGCIDGCAATCQEGCSEEGDAGLGGLGNIGCLATSEVCQLDCEAQCSLKAVTGVFDFGKFLGTSRK